MLWFMETEATNYILRMHLRHKKYQTNALKHKMVVL